VKLTVNVAVLLGALLDPSIWRIVAGLTEKFAASVFAIVTVLAVVPLFVMVNVFAVPLDPTFTEPKPHELGLTASVGGSNCVVADRPERRPVPTTSYSPGTVAFRTNWYVKLPRSSVSAVP